MKCMKCMVAIIVVSFILFSFVPVQVSAVRSEESPTDETIMEKISSKILNMFFTPMKGFGAMFPASWRADPASLEIDYLGKAETEIRLSGLDKVEVAPILDESTVSFEVVYPEGTPKGAWTDHFDPPIVNRKKLADEGAEVLKTKLTLSLNVPPNATDAVHDMILRVKVTESRKYGNLFKKWPFWSIMPPPIGNFFAQWSSMVDYHESYVDVFVKLKRHHFVDIEVPPPTKMGLNEVKSISIKVRNLGNNIDSFGFQVVGGDDKLKVSAPNPITLFPGEMKQTVLVVSSPDIAYDRGTMYTGRIEVYSLYQPDVVLTGRSLIVTISGVRAPEMFSVNFGVFVVPPLVVVGVIFVFWRRKHRLTKPFEKLGESWSMMKRVEFLKKFKKDKSGEKDSSSKKIKKLGLTDERGFIEKKKFMSRKTPKERELEKIRKRLKKTQRLSGETKRERYKTKEDIQKTWLQKEIILRKVRKAQERQRRAL